jgi:hypothetical protein
LVTQALQLLAQGPAEFVFLVSDTAKL